MFPLMPPKTPDLTRTLNDALERLARDHGPAVDARVTAVVSVDGDFLLEGYEVEMRVRAHHSWQTLCVVHDARDARAIVRAFMQRQATRRMARHRLHAAAV